MTHDPTVAFGAFPADVDIQFPIDSLLLAGFPNTDISLLVPESIALPFHSLETDFMEEWPAEWPVRTAPTAKLQAGVEGALERLTGSGEVAIPGVGRVLAAGPILAALAGMNAGYGRPNCAASFIGLGIPAYEAGRYERWISQGGSLVSILCENLYWDILGQGVLIATGGEHVSSTREFCTHLTVPRSFPFEANS